MNDPFTATRPPVRRRNFLLFLGNPGLRRAGLAVLLLGLSLTPGCTNRYLITLTNGNQITSKGKPRLNQERSVYEYKNAEGNPAYVPMIRVSEIEPVPWPPPKDAATQLQELNRGDY